MWKNKYVIGVVCVLLLIIGVKGCTSIGALTYSEGERTGVITKLSSKGMMVKTWEGELNMGGYETGGKAAVWAFSVDDPKVVEKIHSIQRSGVRCTLKYRQQFMKQSWRGATEYFIVDVIPLDKGATQ